MKPAPCPTCDSPVEPDDRFCESCGTPLGDAPPVEATTVAVRPVPPTTTRGTSRVDRSRDRVESELGSAAAVSDRGRHHRRNEDAMALAAIGRYVAAVICDGVSATANPHRASRQATRAALGTLSFSLDDAAPLSASDATDVLSRACAAAQRAVLQVAGHEPGRDADSPSTTIVAALVTEGSAVVANIGDSRAYWLSAAEGESCLLTTDDSWAEEAIAGGWEPAAAYADERAHSITRWLGPDAGSVTPSITAIEIHEPGVLLVCTDGLWNYFESADQLADLVTGGPAMPARRPLDTARLLVEAALEAGGQDNITVAVIECGPAHDNASGPRPAPNRE